MTISIISGKNAEGQYTVDDNGYIGVPPVTSLVQPSFGVVTSERNWTHGVAQAGIVACLAGHLR